MLNWRLENAVPGPIAGNPGTIAQFAGRYERMSDALYEAVDELTALANKGVTISLAVDEVRERARDSIATTRKVAIRYEGAARTLNNFQSSLNDAIQSASGARNTITSNNPSAGYWRRRERDLRLQLLLDPTNNTLIDDVREASRWAGEYDDEYYAAISTYNSALQARDTAVNTAIAGLADAAEAAGLNDNWYEAIEGVVDAFYDLAQKYLAPIVSILRDVLEIIKKIVDVLALIVTILAIFIPVLAPIAAALTVISLVLAAAILLCSLVLFALGKETLGRVIGDVIDLAVGVITAKMGGIKFSTVAGEAVQAASTIGREGLEVAASYVIKAEAAKFATETATELALEFAASGDKAFHSMNEMHISDLALPPGVNSPWGAPLPIDTGNFAPTLGDSLFEAVTLGVGNPYEFGYEKGESMAGAGIEWASNVNQVTAVPAG